MKKLKLYLFSTVILLFIVRLILRYSLPNNFYVPDESTWSRLASWIYSGGDTAKFEGFDISPFFGAQAFVLPSVWQIRFLSVSSLDAVRNTSLIYGMGSIVLFALMILLVCEATKSFETSNKKLKFSIPVCLMLIYGLLPTHTLWAVIGLRDSAAEFFVMLACLSVQYSLSKEKQRLFSGVLSLIALVGLSASRAQVAWVMCLLFIIASFLSLRISPRRLEFALIGIIAFPFCLIISNSPTQKFEQEISINQGDDKLLIKLEDGRVLFTTSEGLRLARVNGKLVVVNRLSKSIIPIDSENTSTNTGLQSLNFSYAVPGITINEIYQLRKEIETYQAMSLAADQNYSKKIEFEEKNLIVKNNLTIPNANAPLERFETIDKEREAKRKFADGVISEVKCPISTDSKFVFLSCEIYRLPFSTMTFMFRPFFFESATSQDFKNASLENIFWFLMFFLTALVAIAKKWRPRVYDFPAILFLIIFTPAASLTEGNFGTAVRHKSVTLWAILFIFLSVSSRYELQTRRRLFSRNKSTSL